MEYGVEIDTPNMVGTMAAGPLPAASLGFRTLGEGDLALVDHVA